MTKKISILGATGSVGQNTVDVILSCPDMFDVDTVTAQSNVTLLAETAIKTNAKHAIIANKALESELRALMPERNNITVSSGMDNIIKSSTHDVDLIFAAIMGFAGLRPIMAALSNGTNVAIANKEPLVAAGAQIMALAQEKNAKILPVDSEHNAIFQVFENDNKPAIESLILTASGGPFLGWDKDDIYHATPTQAIAHPNWTMGAKISVDSATMMNKALEIIEAHYLFDMPAEKIDVLIHPQSTIHSMVAYCDGSILSQMGASDMRTPIAYALAYPERMQTSGDKINIDNLTQLTFQKPDPKRFPAIDLAYACINKGQYACIALNAANEVAVGAFLDNHIQFGQIIEIVSETLSQIPPNSDAYRVKTIEDIEEIDHTVRQIVLNRLKYNNKPTDNE